MNLIERAIEKDRPGLIETPASIEPDSLEELTLGLEGTATPAAANGPTGGPTGGHAIQYTRTATFVPPPEVQREHRLVMGAQDPATVGAYKLLRTQVLQRMKQKGWRVLAVTSPGPGEGKTLTAVNLALSLAHDVNQTVLLADLDLRRPAVHRAFGYEPTAGIGEHLFDGVPLADLLFTPGVERLVVLPGRTPVPNSSEVLASPRMAALVRELKNRYANRLILFDLPPVLSTDDAIAFAPYVDAALIVVREGATTRDALERALRSLGQTPILGTVLNGTAERFHSYYSYY